MLTHAHVCARMLTHADVRRFLGTIAVVLRGSGSNSPPYWIDNLSAYTLRIYQAQADSPSRRFLYLRPYQRMPYAWEIALADTTKNALVVQVEGSSPLLQVCPRMLPYADVCRRMLMYAAVC